MQKYEVIWQVEKVRGLISVSVSRVPQGNSTGVRSSWVTSNICESDNKDKSFLSRSWTIYLYKHNIGVVDRKLNYWLPGKFKMFSLNKLLHGWLLPTWGSPPCRLALISDHCSGGISPLSLLVCLSTRRNSNGTAQKSTCQMFAIFTHYRSAVTLLRCYL